jgi:hypothetical protein
MGQEEWTKRIVKENIMNVPFFTSREALDEVAVSNGRRLSTRYAFETVGRDIPDLITGLDFTLRHYQAVGWAWAGDGIWTTATGEVRCEVCIDVPEHLFQ